MDKGTKFERLLRIAKNSGIDVRFTELKANYALIKGCRLTISNDMTIDEINFNLAHELAHFYLHSDKGNIRANSEECEMQADRAAKLLLDALEIA